MKTRIRVFFLILPLLAALPAAAQNIDIQTVATGLNMPVGATSAGDGSGRLFIVEQLGRVLIWDGTQVLPTPFLDIRGRVTCCFEQGLLGLTFHPDYENNGYFFVNYINHSGNTVVARYEVTADPNVADPTSEAVVLVVLQPDVSHNAGDLAFGPDGYLYIPTGDGGGGSPTDRSQDLGNHWGKILRIDVDGALPHEIPPDNPFVDDPEAMPAIWAYGLRNPWRIAFDRETGDLFIGDAGQDTGEEIDFQPASSTGGENYGWRLMEGTRCFDPPVNCNDGTLTLPILEYLRFDPDFNGCAVIGGARYRGPDFPGLEGLYFYSDNCTGKIWAGAEDAGLWTSSELLDTEVATTSFGQDDDGNLFMVGNSELYRIVATDPFCSPRMAQDVYSPGDPLEIESLRVVNLGSSAVAGRVQVALVPPNGPPRMLIDRGADGSTVLPAGSENNLGPLALGTFPNNAPLGDYEMRCRLSDPATGATLATFGTGFTLQ